jgi:2-oxoglutarate dehydrogenase E2 component (dihydrolipoamide succinyltransferase)
MNELVTDRSKFTVPIEVKIPDMGTGQSSKIVEWWKKVGDVIQQEDVLCDIETPDFTYGLETDDEELAVLHEIFYPAGPDPLPAGTVICTLLHDGKSAGVDSAPAAEASDGDSNNKEEEEEKKKEDADKK